MQVVLPPIIITPNPLPPPPLATRPPILTGPGYWNGITPIIYQPEDIDRIGNRFTIEMAIPFAGIAARTQANIEISYQTYSTNLAPLLEAELSTLIPTEYLSPIDQAEKQLSALQQLITQKREEFSEASVAAVEFFGREPFQKPIKQNAVDFVNKMQKLGSARASTVYSSFIKSISTGYKRKVLSESITLLAEKEKTLQVAVASARADAERAAVEAHAQAEAQRVAAEAAAKAEAERTAAEAPARAANTYSASGAAMVGGSALITAAGSVVSNTANFALRATIAGAIGALAGLAQAVAAGFVVGVTALLYSPRLGNGELPKRFALHTPLSDLSSQLAADLQTAANVAVTADLPFRISSRTSDQGESEIFVVAADGESVPRQVRVIGAVFNAQDNTYTAVTADTPPRTLVWTPAVSPGESSTSLPGD